MQVEDRTIKDAEALRDATNRFSTVRKFAEQAKRDDTRDMASRN